jgi:hypothetical protein
MYTFIFVADALSGYEELGEAITLECEYVHLSGTGEFTMVGDIDVPAFVRLEIKII